MRRVLVTTIRETKGDGARLIRRSMPLVTASVLTLVLAVIVHPSQAVAHAELVDSTPSAGSVLPEPPSRIVARFSEELDPDGSTLVLLDSGGRQVDSGDGGVDLNDLDRVTMTVTLPSTLPDGVYTVRWSSRSAEDGDAAEGTFAFSVDPNAPATTPAATSPTATSAPLNTPTITAPPTTSESSDGSSRGLQWGIGLTVAALAVVALVLVGERRRR